MKLIAFIALLYGCGVALGAPAGGIAFPDGSVQTTAGMVNTGTPVVGAVPAATDTTGTNWGPSSVTVSAATNLTAGTLTANSLGTNVVPQMINAFGTNGFRAIPQSAATSGDQNFWGSKNITAASWVGGVATITTAVNEFQVGQLMDVSSVNPSGYNGRFRITATPTTTTTSYALSSNPGAWVSGGQAWLEPEAVFASGGQMAPALVVQSDPNAVSGGVDQLIPAMTVTSGDGKWNQKGWSIMQDGHTEFIYVGGTLKSFRNGPNYTATSDHEIGWTSTTSSTPTTTGNRDVVLGRLANGTAAIWGTNKVNYGQIAVSGVQGGITKVLTSTTAASLLYISLPNTNFIGGDVIWEVGATDGSDVQSQTGRTRFDAVAKGTAVTATTTSFTNSAALTGGSTLTVAIAANTATNNVFALGATATTSLTTTNLVIKWRLETPSTFTVNAL